MDFPRQCSDAAYVIRIYLYGVLGVTHCINFFLFHDVILYGPLEPSHSERGGLSGCIGDDVEGPTMTQVVIV